MKKDTNSKDNGFELDDFWGFSDSNSQDTNKTVEDDAWSFDDFFAAKEAKEEAELAEQKAAQEQAAAREAIRRQIEAEFAAKKKADEEAAAKRKEEELRKAEEETQARLRAEAEAKRVIDEKEAEKERVRQQVEEKAKLSQTRRKPIRIESTGEAPAPEEFSDTSTMSLNRLKPEIHLTAVEPLISDEPGSRTTDYDAEELEYEDEYEYEDGGNGEEYEYEDGEYDEEYEYEDGEYDEEYEYEDGEYDEEYDYEAEEEKQPAGGFVPVKQTAAKSPAGKYGSAEDWEALERDDDEDEGKSKKPLIIGIVCGIVVLVLVAVIVWAFNRGDGKEKEPVAMTSSVVIQQKTMTGVITSIDADNQTLSIYDAKSGKEAGLNMKEVPHLMAGLAVGDIVDTEYEATEGNIVSKLMKSSATVELNGVKNAVPNGSIIEIDGKTYYFDDKLICSYQDQDFDVNLIRKNTIYDAVALDDHIYTIVVTYATGTLKLENLNEYVNATIVLTPANDEAIEMLITGSMQPIDIQEGSVEIQIKNDTETLYTGKTFISAGKENTLKLPNIKDQKGKVVFSSNIEEEMTILVDGQEYKGTDEVEMAYGEYTGTFTAPGYQDVELKFTISQPYQQVSVEFEENTTLVTISANLWGVSLYVDGVYQGELDGNSIGVRLAAGAHAITCTKTGYRDQHQSIMILEGMEDQMLHFSGFEALQEESSTPTQESSTPVEESSTPTQESSTPVEESSTPTQESSTPVEESSEPVQESSTPVEESSQESTGGEGATE